MDDNPGKAPLRDNGSTRPKGGAEGFGETDNIVVRRGSCKGEHKIGRKLGTPTAAEKRDGRVIVPESQSYRCLERADDGGGVPFRALEGPGSDVPCDCEFCGGYWLWSRFRQSMLLLLLLLLLLSNIGVCLTDRDDLANGRVVLNKPEVEGDQS